VKYIPSKTCRDFHLNEEGLVKLIIGPYGSGKSVACSLELLMKSMRQTPGPDGVRYTRWAIVRNSFRQLRSTTIHTFQDWIPPSECNIVYDSPIRGTVNKMLPDGTRMHAEFWFFPLDSEGSLGNLLSLELTGAWINEASEISKEVFTGVMSRCGRYPKKDKGELSWSGVIMDTNPPVKNHWIYNTFEQQSLPGFSVYHQPPALLIEYDPKHPNDLHHARFIPNPEAENVIHQQKGYNYWLDIANASRDNLEHIKRVVLGEYTMGLAGKPVYSAFIPHDHLSDSELRPTRSSIMVVGMDFGLNGAAVLTQFIDGRLYVLDEITATDTSLIEFIEELFIPLMRARYPGYQVLIVGDPAGMGRSGIDKATPINVLAQYGFTVMPAHTNSISNRIDAVSWFLRRRDAFVVDAKCDMLISGFYGGYKWKEKRGTNGMQSIGVPDKNEYSHIHDACQYACLYYKSGGEVHSDLGDKLFGDSGDGFFMEDTPAQVASKRRFLYV